MEYLAPIAIFVIVVAVILAVTAFPVMLAAHLVGAGKTGFGWALLAVLLQVCLSGITREFASSALAAIIIAIVGGSAIFAFILDTTWLRGFGIGVLSTLISVAMVLLLGNFFSKLAYAI